MLGTIVNVGAIVIGAGIGVMMRSRLPDRQVKIIFQAVGLATMALGMGMAIKSENMIFVICSVVAGSVVGEALRLEERLERSVERIRKKIRFKNELFTQGFITATVLYCVGSMAILGAIEDGAGLYPEILYAKSIMDGVSAIAIGSTFGIGVIFSIIPVFLYQGLITLLAGEMSVFFTPVIIADLTAVGGVLLLGIAINLLELRKISVVNMLPSLIVIVFISWLFG